MSFLDIELKPIAEKKTSWIDQVEANQNGSQTITVTPDKPTQGPQEAIDLMVFEYPEIDRPDEYPTFKIDKIDHKTPRHWRGLMMSDRDFLNWFETICMAAVTNARWNFPEFWVPTALREKVGGDKVVAYSEMEEGRREVMTWRILNTLNI